MDITKQCSFYEITQYLDVLLHAQLISSNVHLTYSLSHTSFVFS